MEKKQEEERERGRLLDDERERFHALRTETLRIVIHTVLQDSRNG